MRRRSKGQLSDAGDAFEPIAVREIELATALEPVATLQRDGRPYASVRILVRLHGAPMGIIELPAGGSAIEPQVYAAAAWRELGPTIDAHLRDDGLPGVGGIGPGGLEPASSPPCQAPRDAMLRGGPPVSVLVCTRNRAEVLARSLESLLEIEYPDFEVLVVDGSPGTETADIVRKRFPDVHYLNVSPHRLTVARNRGVAAAGGAIVAFTDDDVRIDRHWLAELVAPFATDPRLGCATGAVVPLELETPAQLWFEESGAFTDGFRGRAIDIDMATRPGSLLPYATGKIGAGVSMAWRRAALDDIGGFDPGLDAITPPWPPRASNGTSGEDLVAFFDALVAGYRIRFVPRALVYHEHRRSVEELSRQLYWHGLGLGAYLVRCLAAHPGRIPDFVRRVPGGIRYGFASDSERNREKSEAFPRELTRAELRGIVEGPLAYVRGVPLARRLRAAEQQSS